jgi:hypothetical protein
MKLLDDTSPEARKVLTECYRRMSPARKWQMIEDANLTARLIHAAAVRSRIPSATNEEVHADWLRLLAGRPLKPVLELTPMFGVSSESLNVVREVVAILRSMEIEHALGGSFASSYHGNPRQTKDADITVEPFAGRETEFVAQLGPAYYANVESIREANRERSSFNIIHTVAGFKVDLFVRKDRPFELSALRRRVWRLLSEDSADRIEVHSPEDTILQKLEWFRLGGEISDRQWGDILGVLRVQAGALDDAYLDHWAKELNVDDLLREARQQV